MSKTCLSQNPKVLIRAANFENMPLSGPTSLLPRNQLPDKLIKEYQKTATLVENPPWHLDRAAKYLRDWTAENVSGAQKHAPSFALEKKKETGSGESVLVECDRFQEFAPDPPKPVSVLPGPPALNRDPKPKAKSAAKKPGPPTAKAKAASQATPGPKLKAKAKAKAKTKAAAKPKPKAKATLKRPAAAITDP